MGVLDLKQSFVVCSPTEKGVLAKAGMPKEVEIMVQEKIISSTAVKRMGLPQELANMVLFLASDKAAFITGSEFLVDAGTTNYTLK